MNPFHKSQYPAGETINPLIPLIPAFKPYLRFCRSIEPGACSGIQVQMNRNSVSYVHHAQNTLIYISSSHLVFTLVSSNDNFNCSVHQLLVAIGLKIKLHLLHVRQADELGQWLATTLTYPILSSSYHRDSALYVSPPRWP